MSTVHSLLSPQTAGPHELEHYWVQSSLPLHQSMGHICLDSSLRSLVSSSAFHDLKQMSILIQCWVINQSSSMKRAIIAIASPCLVLPSKMTERPLVMPMWAGKAVYSGRRLWVLKCWWFFSPSCRANDCFVASASSYWLVRGLMTCSNF